MDTLQIERVDYQAYAGYLNETEAELLKLAVVRCAGLHDQSQFTAVLFLLIRALSLFRSLLLMMEGEQPLDACDAVRRAYLEAWLLAFEFRLIDSEAKATQWHNGKAKSWSADIPRLKRYAQLQGAAPMLGQDYGGLSKIAHPTKEAASNSVNIVAAPYGAFERDNVKQAKASLEAEMPMMMYRFLWLVIDERAGLISLDADLGSLPKAVSFVNAYVQLSGRTVAP